MFFSFYCKVITQLVSDASDDNSTDLSSSPGINKKFKCRFCTYDCESKSQMSYHTNTHTGKRPFKCNDCTKRFSGPDSLRNHRKTHLPPKYQCRFCPKNFTLKWDRKMHQNIHTNNKPFECEKCKKGFASSSGLSHHRVRQHLPPSFKCQICSKLFKTSSNLIKHQNTHLPPKFECPFCSKKFSQPNNCRTHWNGDKNGHVACKMRRLQIVMNKCK